MYELIILFNVLFLIYTVLVLVKPDKFMPFINATPLVKRIGICVVYGLFWICGAFYANAEREKMKKAEAEAAKKEAIETEKETQRILVQEIKDDSIALSKGDYYKLSSSPTMSEIDELLKKHNHIELSGGANNPEREKTLEYVKAEEKKQWAKAVPSIRKAYVKIIKDKLWLDNIDVFDSNGGTTIWFVGGTFASNRNIQSHYEGNRTKLKQLEFKHVCYKWIKHADEYTSYDL